MKKISLGFVLLMVLLGSCGPDQLEPIAPPTASPLPTFKVTSTPVMTATFASTAISAVETTAVPTLPPPNIHEAQLREIHMLDETSGWAWAVDKAYENYLLHTSDGGLNWKDVTPDRYTWPVFFLNGQIAWAALFDLSSRRAVTLMQTTDGGDSWMSINENMQAVDRYPYLSTFAFEDEKNGWWRTGTVGAGTAHVYYYRTKDGGMTWEPAIINIPKDMSYDYYLGSYEDGEIFFCNICGTRFYFDLSRIIYAPGQWSPTTFFLTTDLGKTWQKTELTGLPADIDPESSPIQRPTFFDDKEGFLPVIVDDPNAEATQVFIYGTQDGGLTWELQSRPTMVDKKTDGEANMEFISRSDGFLHTEKNLWITHDGGKTWTQIPWPEGFTSSETARIESQLNFVNPKIGWVFLEKRLKDVGDLLASRLLRTSDGGLTWIEIAPVINP